MTPSAAVFGKLPAHGDFVARGLDPTARTAWDRLLSDGLAQAEASLGHRFEAAHEGAAPWRFRLTPDAGLSLGYAVGVLVPSIDRVGRRFLLLVMMQGLAPTDADRHAARLSERLEQVALTTFTEGRDADALLASAQAAADAFGLQDGGGWPAEGLEDRWWLPDGPEAVADEACGPGATAEAIGRMLQAGTAGPRP